MYRLKDARIVWTLIIAAVAIMAFRSTLDKVVDLGMRPMNRQCAAYLDDWTNQAVATAGTAGLMNAGLSVIEDSEPGGLGASLALGDLVRPLNGMASRVMYVALAAAVSLEIQQKLIEIGALIGLKWFFALSMVCLGLAIWFDWSLFRRLAWGLFVLALVARLLIPGAVYLTGTIGNQLSEAEYGRAQAQFEELQSEATKAKNQVVDAIPTAKDVWDSIVPWGGSKVEPATPAGLKQQVLKVIDSLAKMQKSLGRLATTLISVFILQTILMPLLILWALVKLPGYLLGPSGIEGAGEGFLGLLRGGRAPIGRSPQVPERVLEAQP